MSTVKLWRPAIEFNVTEHCNLRCEHCDHASGLMAKQFADLNSFVADVTAVSDVVEAGEFKILGGEPLLHPNLVEFLQAARDSQIARRIVLVTNGTLLHKAPDRVWELIDGLWISVYPGVKLRFTWDWVQQQADRFAVFVWRKETPDFSVRNLTRPIPNQNLVEMVYQNCDLAHLFSCNTIYQGRYYLCSPSVWVEPRLAIQGVSFANRNDDSVAIHDNLDLRAAIDSLIKQRDALKACSFCLGSWARRTPNKQMSRQDVEGQGENDSPPVSHLIHPEWILPRQYEVASSDDRRTDEAESTD